MRISRLLFTLSFLFVFCDVALAGRPTYRPASKYQGVSLTAKTNPLLDNADIALEVTATGVATLTLTKPSARFLPDIVTTYTARFNWRTLQATFVDEATTEKIRIYLKRSGRTYSLSYFGTSLQGDDYIKATQYRFDTFGNATIQYSVSKGEGNGYSNLFYVRHSYKTVSNGDRQVVTSYQNNRTVSAVTGTSTLRTHTHYRYDDIGRRKGNIVLTYSTSSTDPEPIAGLSYYVTNFDELYTLSASTSEKGAGAARFFQYTDALAKYVAPEQMNHFMDRATASYYSKGTPIEQQILPRLTVEYKVITYGYSYNIDLVPLGGRLDYGKFYIANGAVDAINGSDSEDPADAVIHWPYPYFYSNAMHQAGISAQNVALLYSPQHKDYGFIFIGNAEAVFYSASDFLKGEDGKPLSATVNVEGEKIHFELDSEGYLQFSAQ